MYVTQCRSGTWCTLLPLYEYTLAIISYSVPIVLCYSILGECKHCGPSVSEVLAHAYVSGDAPSAALLAPSLVSVSFVGGPPRNDSSSGSRTRSLLFQCDLSPTWGYIRQHCSLCRCSLLCESIPKLAALQPPWPCEQFGILRKLFETLY